MIRGTGFASSLQQTFTARRPGLNGITLWLAPREESQPASLEVELYRLQGERAVGQGESPIFRETVAVSGRGPVRISLPPRSEPPGQKYLLLLRSPTGQPVEALGRKADVYPGGSAYLDGRPIDADLAFRAAYRYSWSAAWEDLQRFAGGAWLGLPLALAFFVPGWLVLEFSGLRKRFDPAEQAALSLGLSLAIIPLAMLWSSLLDLRWNRSGVLFTMGAFLALVVWRAVQPALSVKVRLGGSPPHPAGRVEMGNPALLDPGPEVAASSSGNEAAPHCPGRPDWITSLVGLVFLISLAVRLAMVRDLAAPAWVDSVHHALITRLIQEAGGFPDTYAPYLSLPSTYYHAGFHSSMAVFGWLSGLEIPEALLVAGQVLNALAVLAAYLLATILVEDRLAGLLAALITGLATPMPAYYTSWGRYTQLAGLLILPAVLALFKQALPPGYGLPHMSSTVSMQAAKNWLAALLCSALAAAGLFIVHYRVFAFLAVFLPPYLLVAFFTGLRRQPPAWWPLAWRFIRLAGLLGLGTFLLALPWIAPNLPRFLPEIGQASAAPPKPFSDFTWRFLTAALGRYATVFAGVGLAWGLVRKRSFAPILIAWTAGMFLLANLGALRLPGGSLVNNTSVEIALFLPISVSAGFLLSQFTTAWDAALPICWRLPYRAGMAGLFAVLAGIGAGQLLPILNPATFLFRQADRQAIQWIKENIPQEETILINPFLWGYRVYAGNDGGFWISPLAGQQTMPPPVIYGFGGRLENQEIGAFCEQVIRAGDDPQALWSLLQARRIRYVYLGARGGPLSPAVLTHTPLFRTLYHRDGTWVLEAVADHFPRNRP